MVTHADIVAEARKYAGVRWRHQGRSMRGIDCAGVPVVVGGTLGLITHDPRDYHERPDGSFLKHFDFALIRTPLTDMRDGDVLVFTDCDVACHCGIATTLNGEPGVIHSHRRRGIVIEETLEHARSVVERPTRCYRFPGVEA